MLLFAGLLPATERHRVPDHMKWFEQAACKNAEVTVFFPADAREPDAWHRARAVCSLCPVRKPCLAMVIDLENTDDKWGMFGGLTPYERRNERRKRAQSADRRR